MMRSMLAGVSGLKTYQTQMDVLGNNIANVNTTGFKASRVTFQDMLSQTLKGGTASSSTGSGGTDASQVGLGVLIGSIGTLMTQGNLSSTGNTTDMAIQGNGFFVVGTDTANYYTRDGSFDLNSEGYLISSSNGYKVKGWLADTDGNITVTQTVDPIQITIGQEIAQATSSVTLTGTLNSNATAATQGSVSLSGVLYSDAAHTTPAVGTTLLTSLYDSSGNQLIDAGDTLSLSIKKGDNTFATETFTVTATSDYQDVTDWMNQYAGIASGESYTYSGSTVNSGVSIVGGAIRMCGNLGAGNSLSAITLTSDGTAATELEAVMDDMQTVLQAADGTTVTSQMTVYDSQGGAHIVTMRFSKTADNTWNWTADCADDTGSTCVTNDGAIKTLGFTTTGAFDASATTGSISIDVNGVDRMAITPTLSSLNQLAGSSAVSLSDQNGFAKGTLESFTVGSDGVITGVYSNGMTKDLAQIAVCSFNNASGLLKNGNNIYLESSTSGNGQLGTAGTGGRGEITAGVLEMSNVDLAQTFTDMIIAQRGYQANAKIISASDTMLRELVNLMG